MAYTTKETEAMNNASPFLERGFLTNPNLDKYVDPAVTYALGLSMQFFSHA